jgi:hypothetical protein
MDVLDIVYFEDYPRSYISFKMMIDCDNGISFNFRFYNTKKNLRKINQILNNINSNSQKLSNQKIILFKQGKTLLYYETKTNSFKLYQCKKHKKSSQDDDIFITTTIDGEHIDTFYEFIGNYSN